MIFFTIIVLGWIATWFLNQRYDDDPFKDFLRYVGATALTGGVLFFWHWI